MNVRSWQAGLGGLLLVGAGAVGGFVMARELETREERLARRYVVAQRAWRTCKDRPLPLTADDITAILGENTTKASPGAPAAPITPDRLSFDDMLWIAEGCEREKVELDIVRAAVQLTERRR